MVSTMISREYILGPPTREQARADLALIAERAAMTPVPTVDTLDARVARLETRMTALEAVVL